MGETAVPFVNSRWEEPLGRRGPEGRAARDEGDESPQGASLERIYRSHRPSVLTFFRRSLRSDRDIEDLTRDTFLRAQCSGSLEGRRHPGALDGRRLNRRVR
ncbi:MAG: hypothetical protein IPN83_04495 [Holophagales bacterium]|nr:hypothetical protein [Holophagales bacterium]